MLAALDLQAVYLGDRFGYYRALADGALDVDGAGRPHRYRERYVREWLEQQAVTGILVTDAGSPTPSPVATRCPPVRRPADRHARPRRTSRPSSGSLSGRMKQTDLMVEAFRTGGGVTWAQHGADLREGQAGCEPAAVPRPAGPGVPAVDLGRRRALRAGGRVADVGCGLGWSSIGIALAYPDATVDGYDVDGPSIEAARRNAREAGVDDRVRFHAVDAATVDGESYDAVFAFECIHDLPDPVGRARGDAPARRRRRRVVVMDERVAETFTAPGDDVERLMYGYSLVCCLADGMAHRPSAGTGTVMRPSTLRRYAVEAGFADVEILDIDNDFFRFYRLR